MKIRKGLMLVVVLLAVASLMAAMAYNTATITNKGDIKVTCTDEALLSLIPNNGVGNQDETADIEDGNLNIQFGRGNNPSFGGDQNYGLQKNSVYVWDNLFIARNKSAETIKVSLKAEGVPNGVKIFVKQTDGGVNEKSGWEDITDDFVEFPYNIGSGWTSGYSFKVEVDDTADYNDTITDLEIIVKAEAQD